jgi:hypothetical protein
MGNRAILIAITALALVAIPPIFGALIAVVGHLAGMRRPALVTLVVGAVTAGAAGVLALGSLIAELVT